MLNWRFLRRTALAGALACLGTASLNTAVQADDELTIGSTAPALDVEHWVQNGNGKFKPVTEFEKGKVYVVEFWATWCGPCVASMPHLASMQKEYAEKGVQIVSISDEDLETVEKFLKRDFKGTVEDAEGDEGDQPKTYRDLTSTYCLTTDPDGSSNKSYMEAAGQNGIPCAFIVGKDHKIEWIGHPMSMDEVLGKVVEDKWDRAAFAEEFKASQKMDLLMAKVMRQARSGKTDEALKMLDEAMADSEFAAVKDQLKNMRINILLQGGKTEEALAAIDELIEAEKNPARKNQMKMARVQAILQNPKSDKFADVLTQAYTEFKDEPQFINLLAWTVYEYLESGDLDNQELLKASRTAAEAAAEAADKSSKAAVLDTAAHLQYLDGDVKAALKTQEQAVELASDSMKPDLEEFLEILKKADK
ncbi:MAG: redoxin domain-containing protein [Pirellulaceae bacterium]